MTRRGALFLALMLLLCVLATPVVAQSASLLRTGNGTILRLAGAAGLDGRFGASLGTAYSIAGVLDVGLTFGVDVDVSESLTRSNIGIAYAVAPVRQNNDVPFSAQVYGAYTYQGEQSDFLTENRLLREARGYRIGISLVRDFLNGNGAGFRAGLLAEYENYLQATTVGFDAEGFTGTAGVDYAEYPQQERRSGFLYGAYLGGVLSLGHNGFLTVGTGVTADEALRVSLRPDLQLLLVR